MDKNIQNETSKFMVWFGENNQIPVDVRRNIIGEYLYAGELSYESAQLVDRWLAFLEYETRTKMNQLHAEFETFKQLESDEKSVETSFSGSVLKQAEAEMMRVALKFKNDFDALKKQKLETAESNEHSSELDEVAELKKNL